MATITFTIPNAILPRVVAGICGKYGYQDMVDDPSDEGVAVIPNPETKAEFCKRMIRQNIKRDVLQWEAEQAYNASQQTGASEVSIT